MNTKRDLLKSTTAMGVVGYLPQPPLPPPGLPAELVAGFPRVILYSADPMPPTRIQSITSHEMTFADMSNADR